MLFLRMLVGTFGFLVTFKVHIQSNSLLVILYLLQTKLAEKNRKQSFLCSPLFSFLFKDTALSSKENPPLFVRPCKQTMNVLEIHNITSGNGNYWKHIVL